MARLPRSLLPSEGVYHVTSRGVARGEIFRDDEDRSRFVQLLRRVVLRSRWTCPVYCLMDNHYHLLVGTELPRLSAGLHRLNGIYAQEFNERYERVGHLFQGRFHARIVRDDEHLAATLEYIRNNPVRIGRCAVAGDWPWTGAC